MWQFFQKQVLATQRRAIPLGILCLVLVCLIDWITGPEVSVSAFYLIPAVLLSWFVGKRAGYVVGVIHAGMWFCVNVSAGARLSSPLLYWNVFAHTVLFISVVWIVHLAKNLSMTLEKLIDVRTRDLQREVESRRTSEEAIRKLANLLAIAEDEERRRLGHEIHDAVGQNLTLLKLRLETLSKDPALGASREKLELLLSVVDDLIRQSRTLIFSLYPSMLDDLGLTPTLRRYAEMLCVQLPVQISVNEQGTAPELAVPATGFLFRAIKELINNAVKHGPAKEIMVQIRWRCGSGVSEAGVRIIVDDDGKGFRGAVAGEAERPGGLGLAWIAERLVSYGGALQWESVADEGSGAGGARVVIDMPLPHDGIELRRQTNAEPVAG